MTLLHDLESRLAAALTAVLGEPATAAVTATADLRFGDYQTNAAMVLAKQRKTNPRTLAQEIEKSPQPQPTPYPDKLATYEHK